MPEEQPKPLIWVGSSYRDFCALPSDAHRGMGFALYLAQLGDKHPSAKPLRGFGNASVIEIIENVDSDTFRCVYTVQITAVVYVLHAFQKKSKRGIATPRTEIEIIRKRLRMAREQAGKGPS